MTQKKGLGDQFNVLGDKQEESGLIPKCLGFFEVSSLTQIPSPILSIA